MNKLFVAIASTVVLGLAPGLVHATVPAANQETVAARKALMATIKTRDMLTVVLAQLELQMHRQAVAVAEAAIATIAARPDLSAEEKAEALEKAKAEVRTADANVHTAISDPALIEYLIAELGHAYYFDYTVDELRQMTAFYASPVGQKIQQRSPFLIEQATKLSRWMVMSRLQPSPPEYEQALPIDPVPPPR
jgi:hypothetical protein